MSTQVMPTPKQQFVEQASREHATTMKVLRAYPTDKLDLRPHPKCKTAKDLAWMFVLEQGLSHQAVTTGFDWSKGMSMPPAPESFDAVLAALEQGHAQLMQAVEKMPEDRLFQQVKFPVAPKTMGDIPLIQFLWFILSDQIHHRGQFSVYLRMADGKLPSIYGPTADEPWM